MDEKLAGTIATVESYKPIVQSLGAGVILRPEEEWYESIVVGHNVKLVLLDGNSYQTRVPGFTLNEKPAGALVDEIPHIASESFFGAKLYVIAECELRELLPKDKFDLERAAALVSIGYPEVTPILPELLEWMQDGNWPVSHVLSPFLASIGEPLAEQVRQILQSKDHLWKYWVLSRIVADSPELAMTLYSDLVKIVDGDPVDEDEKDVKETAKELLNAISGRQKQLVE